MSRAALPYSLMMSLFLAAAGSLCGQTCCSGGVPTSSNLGLPMQYAQTLAFSLTYDLNELNTLKEGTERQSNPGSSRRTHSVMFQAGYSFSARWAVDVFLPFVRQERRSTDFEYSQGIGDLVVLPKFKLLATPQNLTTLTLGLGLKAPTGADDRTSNVPFKQGITLSADLQPGGGSWDGILWAQFTHVTGFRPSMSVLAQSTYTRRGKNHNFDRGSVAYRFGDEFQLLGGVADRLAIGDLLLDPALVLRFRKAWTDRQRNNDEAEARFKELPNTGGTFLYLNPGLSYWLSPDLSFNFNFELPLYAKPGGTQVTPTYRLNAGVFYKIPLKTATHPEFPAFEGLNPLDERQ
ncbi:MAG: transporter [Bacteroidetes bacterium]|nr:MAG: transporter [Bacteroidota bacterium]